MSTTNDLSTDKLHERLRKWAKGRYSLEAGVEALLRSGMLPIAMPYVESWEAGGTDAEGYRHGEAGAFLDFEAFNDAHGKGLRLSTGEDAFIALVLAIVGEGRADLSDVCHLDRRRQDLILAAISHAGGSHEHSVTAIREVEHRGEVFDVEQPVPGAGYAPPLHPWPAS